MRHDRIDMGTHLQHQAAPVDDVAFLDIVRETANVLALRFAPATLHLLAIDNWFGERWLGFAGKYMGVVGVGRRRRLTLPPFVPSRVKQQTTLCRGEQGYALKEVRPLHRKQPSSANFQRTFRDLGPSVGAVWYSAAVRHNGRASVMIYLTHKQEMTAWYGTYTQRGGWTLGKQLGDRLLSPLCGRRCL